MILTSACGTLHLSSIWADDFPTPPKLRLPGDVASPIRCRLDLTVVPDQDAFSGTVEIDVHFAKPTPILWLNA